MPQGPANPGHGSPPGGTWPAPLNAHAQPNRPGQLNPSGQLNAPVNHRARHGRPGVVEWEPPPPPVRPAKRRRRYPAWLPGLALVTPSLILVGIFVYGFMGWNVRVSFTSWRGLTPVYDFVGLRNYRALWNDERWRTDVSNLVVFTVVFVLGALVLGSIMALLLEKGARGETFFRGAFLFPMAISSIATAIVWRWLLDNGTGTDTAGLNELFSDVGLGFLRSDWHKSDSRWAIAAVALPAGWAALSGYVMALFLAGMRAVPGTFREAARMDGASEFQVFWYVLRPALRPVMFSAVLILIHISLKTFDLIYALDRGNLKIDTPSLYMWFTTFDGGFYDRGATIATVLLIGVALVIGPYVRYALRTERR
jgi:glucose/mannose transport system permease protein